MLEPNLFQDAVLTWFDQHGRKNLPWQSDRSPYRVWLSEIMLQQTQVSTVIPYFLAFTARFPDVQTLAQADLDDVLALWAGLGYYARARHLHQTARLIAERGTFPATLPELMALAGIGRSTAGAILSIAFQQAQPILDGNVKRVLSRYCAVAGWTGQKSVEQKLWDISQRLTPTERCADYTQAMMDLGATLCVRSRPVCALCPLASTCQAHLSHSTHLYPAPKPSKTLPVKQVVLLLLSNTEQAILLLKRPSVGIWSGLWSLPEFDNETQALAWCREQGFVVQNISRWAEQRHSFSHYHLDYTPLLITSNSPNYAVLEANQQFWYKHQLQIGLPAPVKQLLQRYYEEEIK